MSHMPDAPDAVAALESQKAALLRKISSWTTSGPVPSPRPRGAVATPVAIAIAPRILVTDLIFA